MHGPNCGQPLEKGERFCGACGANVSAYTSSGQPMPANRAYQPVYTKKKSGGKGLLIALCCVIALGVLAIAVFGMMMLMQKQSAAEIPTSAPTESELLATVETQAQAPTEAPTQASSETSAPTETETEPDTTESTADNSIKIDADTQYKLNLFLSNFSESFFGEWESGNSRYATFDRIHFIFSWYNLNKYDQIKFSSDYDAMLTFEQVNEKHQRFFGESLSRPSDGTRYTNEYGERIYFENGYFVTPWGVGDSHADFTVVRSMTDNGDGTYTVEFDVYTAEDYNGGGDHLTDDSYYHLTPDNVTRKNVTYQYSGRAIVVPYKNGSIDSYQLKAYYRD